MTTDLGYAAALRRLSSVTGRLNTDELRVLATIAERLAAGQRVYGALDLATDQRDFGAESQAEIIDALAYCAMRLIRG